MTEHYQQDIQVLLQQSKICFLVTLGENGPETSMAPFAVDRGMILLHLSSLAKHRVNIEKNPNIGVMICTPESRIHWVGGFGKARKVPLEQWRRFAVWIQDSEQ